MRTAMESPFRFPIEDPGTLKLDALTRLCALRGLDASGSAGILRERIRAHALSHEAFTLDLRRTAASRATSMVAALARGSVYVVGSGGALTPLGPPLRGAEPLRVSASPSLTRAYAGVCVCEDGRVLEWSPECNAFPRKSSAASSVPEPRALAASFSMHAVEIARAHHVDDDESIATTVHELSREGVVSVCAGGGVSFAVTDDGRAFVWGAGRLRTASVVTGGAQGPGACACEDCMPCAPPPPLLAFVMRTANTPVGSRPQSARVEQMAWFTRHAAAAIEHGLVDIGVPREHAAVEGAILAADSFIDSIQVAPTTGTGGAGDAAWVVMRSGVAFVWGATSRARLGTGPAKGVTSAFGGARAWMCSPTPLMAFVIARVKVVAIAAGERHALALVRPCESGTAPAAVFAPVFAWGVREGGRLGGAGGDGCSGDSDAPAPVPALVGRNVVAVAAGGGTSGVIIAGPRGRGAVWMWGVGSSGQLGLGDGTTSAPVPARVPGLAHAHVSALALCATHGAALLTESDGGTPSVWTWGRSITSSASSAGLGTVAWTPMKMSGCLDAASKLEIVALAVAAEGVTLVAARPRAALAAAAVAAAAITTPDDGCSIVAPHPWVAPSPLSRNASRIASRIAALAASDNAGDAASFSIERDWTVLRAIATRAAGTRAPRACALCKPTAPCTGFVPDRFVETVCAYCSHSVSRHVAPPPRKIEALVTP